MVKSTEDPHKHAANQQTFHAETPARVRVGVEGGTGGGHLRSSMTRNSIFHQGGVGRLGRRLRGEGEGGEEGWTGVDPIRRGRGEGELAGACIGRRGGGEGKGEEEEGGGGEVLGGDRLCLAS